LAEDKDVVHDALERLGFIAQTEGEESELK
jgi:hypothetical protein